MHFTSYLYLPIFIAYLVVIFSTTNSTAQASFGLSDCFDYALENNFTLKSVELDRLRNQANLKLAQAARLPNIGASASYSQSFGYRVDPTTNNYINESFGNQGIGLNVDAPIYAGNRIKQQIMRARLESTVAEENVNQSVVTLKIDITGAYLSVLQAQENLRSAYETLMMNESELEQMEKMIAKGVRAKNESLELQSLAAQSRLDIANAQNTLDVNKLILKQLMQMPESDTLIIENPRFDEEELIEIYPISSTALYASAISWHPAIKMGEAQQQSNELMLQVAKTANIPTLSFFGGIGSNWSSSFRAQNVLGEGFYTQDATINGEMVELGLPYTRSEFLPVSYFDQLNRNLGYGLGLRLSIPILQQGRNRANIELAKVDIIQAKIDNDQNKNTLLSDIQLATTQFSSAQEQFQAAMTALEWAEASYTDMTKRHDKGVANNYELVTAARQRDIATRNLNIAKYNLIFRKIIVDFYQTGNIDL